MSRPKMRIKRGDTVKVIAGKDKGRMGKVLRVLPDERQVVVEGVRRVKRHQKAVGERPSGILEKEAPLDISNVALWDVEQDRRIRVGYRENGDGNKVRVDRKTGAVLD